LATVEEHERGCAHALEHLLPEGLDRDIFNGDEDELALTLLDIVEPLQYSLSMLQKARRHALASPLLVTSEEMPPFESANRHPEPSQKLPTSKQPTPPAAPASAPPLSSALIAPSPLSLNLLSYTPPHSTQTGDSNLVANTTINSSRKEKVPQQQGQDIGRPTSNLVVKVTQSLAISPSHRGFVLKMRSPTRSGGFVWKYLPLSECCNDNLFRHAATTADSVIPCSSTLADRPPSLSPFPIDGRGQPLFSPESTSSHTDQVPIDEDSEEAIFAGQNTGSPAVKGNGILHTPVSSRLPHSSSFSPFRRSDPPLFSRLPALMMAFFPLLTSPPVFLPLLPSGARALFPRARVRLNRLLLHPFLVRHPRPLGRTPFPFLASPLPSFLHLLLIRLLSSRLFLFLSPPSYLCLRFLCHFTVFFFTFVKSHNVLHVLS